MALPPFTLLQVSTDLMSTVNANKKDYDGLVILFSDKNKLIPLVPSFQPYLDLDKSFGNTLQLVCLQDQAPFSRILIAPVGSLSSDVDDARRFKDTAFEAGKRCLDAGLMAPLVCFADAPTSLSSLDWTFDGSDDFKHYLEVTMLGFLEACYEPIDVRNSRTDIKTFTRLGFVAPSLPEDDLIQKVRAIEEGRRVSKDIGSPDPEQMSPIQIVKYLESIFRNDKNVTMTVVDDIDVIGKEYPLAHAVARASLVVPRHHPRIVHFEYRSADQARVKENLYFVGKGVTYDTGGTDIKCDGHMRGMSRDKCGAAAVAGFFKTIELLQPKGINASAALALVRNSVGPDSYVSDEIIVSRNGNRVLVSNTDAEGRMAMTDLLCEFKERALAYSKTPSPASDKPALLFTVATLTGHALRAYGGYGATLDNGMARKLKVSRRIHDAGHLFADPFEVSTLRREDVNVVQPGRSSEDVIQGNAKSAMVDRGHQYPAGFMVIASGLDKHGLHDKVPLAYTHLDIAGSAETMTAVGWSLTRVTGSPVVALTGAFLL